MVRTKLSPSVATGKKYELLADLLRQRIAPLAPHDALPTERELLEEYGVSRTTVRQAIQLLLREGLVYNLQGSGTYVANPEVIAKTLRLTSFSQDMIQRGMTPASRLLEQATVPAPALVASRLGLDEGTDTHLVRRLRLADGEPMAIETAYLCAALVEAPELTEGGSLYEGLAAQGLTVSRATQTIEAVNLTAEQAHQLGQAVGAAAMRVRRVTYTPRGQAVEFAESTYRGDRYSYDIVVDRDL